MVVESAAGATGAQGLRLATARFVRRLHAPIAVANRRFDVFRCRLKRREREKRTETCAKRMAKRRRGAIRGTVCTQIYEFNKLPDLSLHTHLPPVVPPGERCEKRRALSCVVVEWSSSPTGVYPRAPDPRPRARRGRACTIYEYAVRRRANQKARLRRWRGCHTLLQPPRLAWRARQAHSAAMGCSRT